MKIGPLENSAVHYYIMCCKLLFLWGANSHCWLSCYSNNKTFLHVHVFMMHYYVCLSTCAHVSSARPKQKWLTRALCVGNSWMLAGWLLTWSIDKGSSRSQWLGCTCECKKNMCESACTRTIDRSSAWRAVGAWLRVIFISYYLIAILLLMN